MILPTPPYSGSLSRRKLGLRGYSSKMADKVIGSCVYFGSLEFRGKSVIKELL